MPAAQLQIKARCVKRFVIFRGDAYYPIGGWEDFWAACDSLEECHEHLATNIVDDYEWAHIVDTDTGEQVWTAK